MYIIDDLRLYATISTMLSMYENYFDGGVYNIKYLIKPVTNF